jgi:hypothetical protein
LQVAFGEAFGQVLTDMEGGALWLGKSKA